MGKKFKKNPNWRNYLLIISDDIYFSWNYELYEMALRINDWFYIKRFNLCKEIEEAKTDKEKVKVLLDSKADFSFWSSLEDEYIERFLLTLN